MVNFYFHNIVKNAPSCNINWDLRDGFPQLNLILLLLMPWLKCSLYSCFTGLQVFHNINIIYFIVKS